MSLTLSWQDIALVASSSALYYGIRWVWPLNGPIYMSNAVWKMPYVLNLDYMSWVTTYGVAGFSLFVLKTGWQETLIGLVLSTGLNYLIGAFASEGLSAQLKPAPQSK